MSLSINLFLNDLLGSYSTHKTKLILLISILGGVSNTAYCQDEIPNTINLTSNQVWKETLTNSSGKISFTLALNQNERFTLAFSNQKKSNYHDDLIRIIKSDQDCVGEHETSISFKENKKNTLSKYFSEKTPWETETEITVTWADDNQFTVKSNDESITLKTLQKPKYIYMISNQSIQLTHFYITK